MVKQQETIVKYLEEIRKNPNMVLTCNQFCEFQWIQWNSDKKCFEYEDNAFLGETPSEVIATYDKLIKAGFGSWLSYAEWQIKTKLKNGTSNKKYRSLVYI